ncbi:MAG TPA: Stp1/IreP family PP2C-type Ser/Thr phosphatase [Acidimicrobiales bacterium]|nr:Stp1/IreP family PP2C-type Ser/Thr phosphatase [Acidimicrobiales bacterium]
MSKLVVGSATDVGLVRTNNQDQFLVAPGLYAVADGMGGHAAGEVASSTAVQALASAFQEAGQRSVTALEAAAKAANRAVWEQARSNRHMLGMGTTLVALAVVERTDGTNGLAIAHIGDSRVYQLRAGGLRQLTVDHSLVQELVDDGQISQAQAAVHPQRHVLTRALGVEPDVMVDLLHIEAEHGDRYLLCSDGLPREASDDQIASVLQRFEDPNEAAKELVALAKSRGGNDNITVVVVDVLPGGEGGGPSIEVPSHASSTAGGVLAPAGAQTRQVLGPIAQYGPDYRPRPDATAVIAVPARTTVLEAPASTPRPVPPRGRAGPARPKTEQDRQGPPGAERLSPEAPGRERLKPSSPGREHSGIPGHLAPGPSRWITWRVGLFVLSVLVVIAAAVGGLAWYARSTYYVQLDRGHITIFQGRPGGVLWFSPTVVQRTKYTRTAVQSRWWGDLSSGVMEASVPAAHQYIKRLVAEEAPFAANPSQPNHPPSTTTSVGRPAVTTTVGTNQGTASGSPANGGPASAGHATTTVTAASGAPSTGATAGKGTASHPVTTRSVP